MRPATLPRIPFASAKASFSASDRASRTAFDSLLGGLRYGFLLFLDLRRLGKLLLKIPQMLESRSVVPFRHKSVGSVQRRCEVTSYPRFLDRGLDSLECGVKLGRRGRWRDRRRGLLRQRRHRRKPGGFLWRRLDPLREVSRRETVEAGEDGDQGDKDCAWHDRNSRCLGIRAAPREAGGLAIHAEPGITGMAIYRVSDFRCASWAMCRVRMQHALDEIAEPAGDVFRRSAEPWGPRCRFRLGDLGQRLPVEGQSAGDRIVKGASEAVEIGARARPLGSQLLGRREVQGEGPWLFRFLAVAPRVSGETQVEELQPSLLREEQVRRIQIAMDDPFFLGEEERGGPVVEQLDGRLPRQGSFPRDQIGESPAWQELHAVEERVRFAAYVVKLDDAGMGSTGREPCLLDELKEVLPLGGGRAPGDLDGHPSRDGKLHCTIHGVPWPPVQQELDPVSSESSSDERVSVFSHDVAALRSTPIFRAPVDGSPRRSRRGPSFRSPPRRPTSPLRVRRWSVSLRPRAAPQPRRISPRRCSS